MFKATPFRLFLQISLFTLLFSLPLFPQWEPDVRLTYDSTGQYLAYPNAWCIAASGDTVHTVWQDDRFGASSSEVYYKRSTDGGVSWGPDTRLTDAPGMSNLPGIAVSGSNVHAVWMDSRDIGSNWEVYTKRSTDGGATWGSDVRLTTDTDFSADPSVAVSNSNVHVVWDATYGTNEVYYKRSTNGGTSWGPVVPLTNASGYSMFPCVAVSGTAVHVVWLDDRTGDYEIYYKRSTNNGATWGSDVRLTNAADRSGLPTVAVLGSAVHVVWYDRRDGVYEIFYKRSTDGGTTWTPDTSLTGNDGFPSYYPSIALSNSNVHVVWADERDGDMELYYKRSRDSGLTWEPDSRLTNAPGWSLPGTVAASGSKVHVVWNDNRDGQSNFEIYYKRNPTGSTGISETAGVRGQKSEVRFQTVPNPFSSFARVPGHERENFAIYDISGRQVGTCRGDRVGAEVSPGIYFIKLLLKDSAPVRIVKVK